jgi:hypothetical protein
LGGRDAKEIVLHNDYRKTEESKRGFEPPLLSKDCIS